MRSSLRGGRARVMGTHGERQREGTMGGGGQRGRGGTHYGYGGGGEVGYTRGAGVGKGVGRGTLRGRGRGYTGWGRGGAGHTTGTGAGPLWWEGQRVGPTAVLKGPRGRSRAPRTSASTGSALPFPLPARFRACVLVSVVRGRPGFRSPRGRGSTPVSMARGFISGSRGVPAPRRSEGLASQTPPAVRALTPGPLGSPPRVGASERRPATGGRSSRLDGWRGRGCSRGITQQAREGLGVLPAFISVASAPYKILHVVT